MSNDKQPAAQVAEARAVAAETEESAQSRVVWEHLEKNMRANARAAAILAAEAESNPSAFGPMAPTPRTTMGLRLDAERGTVDAFPEWAPGNRWHTPPGPLSVEEIALAAGAARLLLGAKVGGMVGTETPGGGITFERIRPLPPGASIF